MASKHLATGLGSCSVDGSEHLSSNIISQIYPCLLMIPFTRESPARVAQRMMLTFADLSGFSTSQDETSSSETSQARVLAPLVSS
jgi:hypothetical protein